MASGLAGLNQGGVFRIGEWAVERASMRKVADVAANRALLLQQIVANRAEPLPSAIHDSRRSASMALLLPDAFAPISTVSGASFRVASR